MTHMSFVEAVIGSTAWRSCVTLVPVVLIAAACARTAGPVSPASAPSTPAARHTVVPVPATVEMQAAPPFVVEKQVDIVVRSGGADVERLAKWLAALLTPALGAAPTVHAGGTTPGPAISLGTDANDASLGEEGYQLTVAADGIRIAANGPAGVFYGLQTLRQLLPPLVEYRGLRPTPLPAPAVKIVDRPRFAWRGAMLDVARHFRPPADVKRYLDLLALYKINRLHLHLSDDQGWRIEIKSWPNLTKHGGSTEVGGGPGGFYTQAEYADLVAYARERFITIVPEIDMPGHTNAALASHPELNCDGVAPKLFTGIEVGFSTLCVDKDVTYRFVDDVVREIGAMTPGPYFHIGGDEVQKLTPEQYASFIERVQEIARKHGKQPIGWDEIAHVKLLPETIVQYWRPDSKHVAAGSKAILSPANKVYIDMKYTKATPIGLSWAALIEVRDAYDWEPTKLFGSLPEANILGVEAPLWSETLASMADVEYMAFPRLAGVAEIAWSPAAARSWDDFRVRIAGHGPRWVALGVNAYRSPQVPWVH